MIVDFLYLYFSTHARENQEIETPRETSGEMPSASKERQRETQKETPREEPRETFYPPSVSIATLLKDGKLSLSKQKK